jgi:hypothetical protein
MQKNCPAFTPFSENRQAIFGQTNIFTVFTFRYRAMLPSFQPVRVMKKRSGISRQCQPPCQDYGDREKNSCDDIRRCVSRQFWK